MAKTEKIYVTHTVDARASAAALIATRAEMARKLGEMIIDHGFLHTEKIESMPDSPQMRVAFEVTVERADKYEN